jgi:chaperonin cofactor prefoldin
VQLSLQQAALNYKEEIQRAGRDKNTAKSELERALKLTDRLSAQLNDLSEDTRFFVNRRTFQRALERTGVPLGRPDRKVSLDKITNDLSRSKDTLELSLSSLRKAGRPSDDALDGLLLQAFLIWVTLLRRPFKLDWTPLGEPSTEAADWCERVCDQRIQK